jgi:hypothetical protein
MGARAGVAAMNNCELCARPVGCEFYTVRRTIQDPIYGSIRDGGELDRYLCEECWAGVNRWYCASWRAMLEDRAVSAPSTKPEPGTRD